jgi:hypothetical protein
MGIPKGKFSKQMKKKKLSYRIIRIKRIFSWVYWCITWTNSPTNLHRTFICLWVNGRYDNVTLIPIVLQLGLRKTYAWYGSKLKFSLTEYFNFLFAYLVITYYSLQFIFFLSDILFSSCYFTCTCLVLEISLFGSIVVKINSKVFHIWHSDPYMDRLRPSREYT